MAVLAPAPAVGGIGWIASTSRLISSWHDLSAPWRVRSAVRRRGYGESMGVEVVVVMTTVSARSMRSSTSTALGTSLVLAPTSVWAATTVVRPRSAGQGGQQVQLVALRIHRAAGGLAAV
jgi:hypothetical protein